MASDDRDARALLAELVATRGPDPQRRRHNWNATLRRLDDDPLADAPPLPRAHASRTWLLAAAGVVVIASALLGAGALLDAEPSTPRSQAAAIDATVPAPQTAPLHVREPAAALPGRESVPTTEMEIQTPSEPPPASAAPRRHATRLQPRTSPPTSPPIPDTPSVVTPERLALETRLLARVREAAAANDDARAIELLQQHAREFADGAMLEDRRAWLAIVQCRSRAPQGKRSAAAFLAAHPRSPYAGRVRTECGEIE